VIVVVLAAILARTALPLAQVLGVALAVAGVALTATGGDLANLLYLEFNRGDVGIFICSISWAIYSLVLKRRAFEAIPTIVSFFLVAASGAAMLAPCMIYEVATVGLFPMSLKAWGSIAGIVIFASVLSFWSYQHGVRIVGPSLTSVFMYLSPGYGIAIAVIFLGEPLQLYHGVGFALILAGVGLATGAHRLFAYRRRSAS
jgi:drug/metabolite transporter (DMT)-like permease